MGGCDAVGCKNTTYKGFSLKRFPSNLERRKIWVESLKRGDWTPTSNSRLCEAHFAPEMFENNRADGRRLLRWNAVPTIFPDIPRKYSNMSRKRRSRKKRKYESEDEQAISINDGPYLNQESLDEESAPCPSNNILNIKNEDSDSHDIPFASSVCQVKIEVKPEDSYYFEPQEQGFLFASSVFEVKPEPEDSCYFEPQEQDFEDPDSSADKIFIKAESEDLYYLE